MKVFVTMKSEFTYENVCEPTSSPKYLAVISKFASYYKALLCLRHSIILEPRSLLPRILALRWSAFLGEWEMAEMALAFEKTKEGKAPQKEATDDYVASHLTVVKGLVKCYSISGSALLKMAHSVNADTRTTFLTFEAQSLANWMCSHIPKVPANFSLDNVEPLDTFNCIHRAVVKSESVVKNRIPGIHKESEPLHFMKVSSNAIDFLKACASYAESCELRREYCVELLNVGMVHDAAFHSQLGLWCALKIGALFRIQQFVNVNTLIRQCVVQVEFKNDLQSCLDIMRIMYLRKLLPKNASGHSKEKDDVFIGSLVDMELPMLVSFYSIFVGTSFGFFFSSLYLMS
uniref:PCI domain-containing protein n=1 Tax=Angiostrongylus cantonensis TaxID=6313 RepID=A0A158PCQ0_ANGCA